MPQCEFSHFSSSGMEKFGNIVANILSVAAPLVVAYHNFGLVDSSLWFWFHPWYLPLCPTRSIAAHLSEFHVPIHLRDYLRHFSLRVRELLISIVTILSSIIMSPGVVIQN